MVVTPLPFNSVTHPIIRCVDDWNNLLMINLEKTCTFMVRANGSYYEGLKGGTNTGAGNLVYGGAGNEGSIDGTVLLDVANACNAAMGTTPGTLFFKDIDVPATFTPSATVMVVCNYAAATVGSDTVKATYIDTLKIGTRLDVTASCNKQIVEIQSHRDTYGTIIHVKPNGDVTGEHRAGIAFWDHFDPPTGEALIEFNWSGADDFLYPNRWFLINTFAVGTANVRPVLFCAQAADPGDVGEYPNNLGGVVAAINPGFLGGTQRFDLYRGTVPNNRQLSFLDTASVETGYIKMDSGDALNITNLKNTDIVLTGGTGAAPKYIRLHPSGDLALPNLQKVAFENVPTTASGTTTSVGAGSTTYVMDNTTHVGDPNDTWNGYQLKFTSGTNNGISRLITDFAVSGSPAIATFTTQPFEDAYTTGDTFILISPTTVTTVYKAADNTFVIDSPDVANFQISVNGKYFYLTSNGDIQIDTANAGTIFKSTNGTRYRLTVSNAGEAQWGAV